MVRQLQHLLPDSIVRNSRMYSMIYQQWNTDGGEEGDYIYVQIRINSRAPDSIRNNLEFMHIQVT